MTETVTDSERLRNIEAMLAKMSVNPETLSMTMDKQKTISSARWIENSKSYSTLRTRNHCLAYWAIANGKSIELEEKEGLNHVRKTWKLETLLKAVDEVLSEIINRKLSS